MTFEELKKEIENEFTEIEVYLEEHPTPAIGANETNPQYLYEYGMKVGRKEALIDILSKWPKDIKPKNRWNNG